MKIPAKSTLYHNLECLVQYVKALCTKGTAVVYHELNNNKILVKSSWFYSQLKKWTIKNDRLQCII